MSHSVRRRLDRSRRIYQRNGMILPANHPLRQKLNDEVHARPPEELNAPCSTSYLALLTDPAGRQESGAKVRELAERLNAPPPVDGANHYSANLGPFRVKWERHSEFARYEFIIEKDENPPFSDPPIRAVPQEWVASLPGELLRPISWLRGQIRRYPILTISPRDISMATRSSDRACRAAPRALSPIFASIVTASAASSSRTSR